ncbi:MAG: hypothetical protein KDH96_08510 [Candidatus Riesia sp.]|nr:hypothetical protein [Candidatus Riesia sp.]
MAAGDFVTSSKSKMREGDVGNNRANSEAVQTKYSGNINGLIDSEGDVLSFEWNGYFSNSELFRKGAYRVEKTSDIVWYQLSLRDTGSGTANGVNFGVYDNVGAFVSDLFGSGANAISISGNTGTDVIIGRNIDDATTSSTNTAGHTVQHGVLNLTTLQAGYILVPYVEQYASSARSMKFSIKIREQ